MIWSELTLEEKKIHILSLHTVREKMQTAARTKRAPKARKRKLKTVFKSKELADLFNSLPPEMQKLVS